jgi:hypothetical protein
VILLGIWGALIPFVGPYFHYAFGSFQTWHYTSERLWLCIVPGAVAVIGGVMLLRSSHRSSGLLGGWLAMAAGAWFAIGPTISLLWHHGGDPIGAPVGGYTRRALELFGYFQGLGVVIVGLAAFAMGRYFSRPRLMEETSLAEDDAVAADGSAAPGREPPVAATAAAAPLAIGGEPLAAHDEVAAQDEPTAVHEEPTAVHEEPIAGHDEPIAAPDEPISPPEERAAPADEPMAPRQQPTPAGEEPAAQADAAAGAPATITYRRRPGLSRFRRR